MRRLLRRVLDRLVGMGDGTLMWLSMLLVLAAGNWLGSGRYARSWEPWAALAVGCAAGTVLTFRVLTSRTGSGAGSIGAAFRIGYPVAYVLFVAGNLLLLLSRRFPRLLVVLMLLSIAPFPLMSLRLRWSQLKAAERLRAGLCPRCGYDLRATPDRCPECGAVPGSGESA